MGSLVKKEIFKADKVLVIALIVSFIFCLHGITSKNMHPDQMAFLPLFNEGKLPFNPGWFERPPFHTYFNYFLTVLPFSIIDKVLHLPPDLLELTRRIWSKLLTTFLFLGSIILVFKITNRSFGLFPARIIALVFATSAGFVAYSHFLTADIPVMFWMLVAFYFSYNILFERKVSYYVLAGFFTGITTATKYNGVAIGITIVVAHLLSFTSVPGKPILWKELLFSKRLFLGLFMVIIGFVVGNPFSILDYPTFKDDFVYNYMVAPVYDGQMGHSYGKFFSGMIEIIGLPAFLIFLVASLLSLYFTLFNKAPRLQQMTILLTLSVLLLYYYKFASFPRLEIRWILPIVPLWLIISGPFWNKVKPYRVVLSVCLAGILTYNLICSFYVGERLLEDPRLLAEVWARENLPQNGSIESDLYSPGWNEIPGVQMRETITPFVTGRERLFEHLFPGNTFINGSEETKRETEKNIKWYSLEELTKRNPDFIAINSLYYQRFIEPGMRRDLYPSMQNYFEALLNEQYPYEITFDNESKRVPAWVYPHNIEFTYNRVTIFAKKKLISDN